jgi:glutamine synthetase type III
VAQGGVLLGRGQTVLPRGGVVVEHGQGEAKQWWRETEKCRGKTEQRQTIDRVEEMEQNMSDRIWSCFWS